MDIDQLLDAVPAINDFSTVASIVCVLPTYFFRLQPATYRLVLSLGILIGLSTLAVEMTVVLGPFSHQYDRLFVFDLIFAFSPLVVVLIARLARIRHVTRVGLWSTVVLASVILDWAGISMLILALS